VIASHPRTTASNGRTMVLVQLNHLGLRGTEINAVDFACAVKKYGYDSVLIAPSDTRPDGPSLFDFAAERGVRLEAVPRSETVRDGARMLRAMAREVGADIMHVYGPWAARSAYLGPCAFGRMPLVLTDYEMALSPDTFSGPHLIVGTGYLLDEQQGRFGPTEMISPPVDLERDSRDAVSGAAFRREFGIPSDQLAAVLVSRIDTTMKAKGIETAIRAMGELRRGDVTLIIVGTGDAESRLRAISDEINEHSGRRAVVFAGPRSDPREAYAAADIALGMGGSAARALAFGTPLIVLGERGWNTTVDSHNIAEIYRNSFWSNAEMEAPVAALAARIAELAGDPERRADLAQLGKAFAEANFGLEAMAKRLAHYYDTAADYGLRRWLYDVHFEAGAVANRLFGWRPKADQEGVPSAYRYRVRSRQGTADA
jgi:glycosyltransferase involved in cell wall biosynthesis